MLLLSFEKTDVPISFINIIIVISAFAEQFDDCVEVFWTGDE